MEIELLGKYSNPDFTGQLCLRRLMYTMQCDKCQRIGNISRRHNMPLNNILEVEFLMYWVLIVWSFCLFFQYPLHFDCGGLFV